MERESGRAAAQGLDLSASTSMPKDELLQLEGELESTEKRVEKLKQLLNKLLIKNQELEEYSNERIKTFNDSVGNPNIYENMRAVIRDKTAGLEEYAIELEQDPENLKQMFNDKILRFEGERQNVKKSIKQSNDQESNRQKELKELLISKSNEISNTRIQCEQFANESCYWYQLLCEKRDELEENKKIISNNERKHNEKSEELSDTQKTICSEWNLKKQEISRLEEEKDERSNKYGQLLSQYEVLEAAVSERKKQVEHLERHIQERKEKQANKKDQFEELKKIHLAMVSEIELKLSKYRKQRQDLEQKTTETTNKLNEISSNNKILLDIKANAAQYNEELINKIQTKDDEIQKLTEDLQKALDLYDELSIKSATMHNDLIGKKKLCAQSEVDLKAYNSAVDKISESESELRVKLDMTKQKLKHKLDEIIKFDDKTRNERLEVNKEMEKLEQELKQKTQEAIECQKNYDIALQDAERLTSASNKKLQDSDEYEKQMKELMVKETNIRAEIAAEKLKQQQENLKITETQRKQNQERETQLNELKSNIAKTEKEISAVKQQGKDLERKLNKAQTSGEIVKEDSLNNSKWSPIGGIGSAKQHSLPTTSTPENSPLIRQTVPDFGFGSSSDLSSISES